MKSKNKIFVIAGFFVFIIAGINATMPHDDEKKFKNLKVLAKDITDDELERVMLTFERQLGVTCMYCHVPTKNNISPPRVDFASDEKSEKLVAREMLKMTMKLNKKYFNFVVDKKMSERPVVWCKTCHMGYPIPHINPFDYKKLPE